MQCECNCFTVLGLERIILILWLNGADGVSAANLYLGSIIKSREELHCAYTEKQSCQSMRN